MEDKELKCKLEEMAAGMGYEVKKKFRQEMDPIYKTFQILIIFGFLTVVTILGTYLTISLNKTPQIIVQEKIVYIDKIIEIPKVRKGIIYKDKIIYIYKDKYCQRPEGVKYLYSKVRKGREYKYFNETDGKVWRFYTESTSIKGGKSCQLK